VESKQPNKTTTKKTKPKLPKKTKAGRLVELNREGGYWCGCRWKKVSSHIQWYQNGFKFPCL